MYTVINKMKTKYAYEKTWKENIKISVYVTVV